LLRRQPHRRYRQLRYGVRRWADNTHHQSADFPGRLVDQRKYRRPQQLLYHQQRSLHGWLSSTDLAAELGGTSSASSCAGGGATGISNSIATWNSIYGGTSFASPIFAGIVTLLNQYLGSASTGLGNINSQLYSLAKNAPSAFHQVTAGDNYAAGSNIVYYCEGGQPSNQPLAYRCPSTGPNAGTMGYLAADADTATGDNLVTRLASVDANKLAKAWASVTTNFTLTPTTAA